MEENKNLLQLLGIYIDSDKIDINLKQAKEFFNSLQDNLEKNIKEFEKSLQEGKVELKNIGLKVDNEHISLNLKEAKSFFENLSSKLEQFSKELNDSLEKLGKGS